MGAPCGTSVETPTSWAPHSKGVAFETDSRIMRENMGDIIILRRARKQRARIAATKDSAAKRAKSGRARELDEKRLEAHRREAAADPE